MKKIIFILGMSTALLLGACSEEEPKSSPEETQEPSGTEEESTESEAPVDQTEVEEKEEETADEDENKNIEFPEGQVDLISYYGTEESYQRELNSDEGGVIPLDFEGFKVDTAFYLVDFRPNEEYRYEYEDKESVRAIMAITQAENTNDFDVDYNGGMTIITDTKEQVNATSGLMGDNPVIGMYYGQVEAEGYYIIPLKDDSQPEKITVIMEGPWQVVDGAVNTETGQMGEEQRFELQAYYE